MLSYNRQHEKCAEILSKIYHLQINSTQLIEILSPQELYHQYLKWMNLPTLLSFSAKTISDRYHWHLKEAFLSRREHDFLPEIRKGDRFHAEEKWPISIYLDHIRSAHNVGSIIRTIEAFSLGDIYFSPMTPYIDQKKVLDTTMGSHQWVNCYQNVKLSELQRPIIALETSSEAISLYDFIFPSSFTLVMGNEEYGCSDEALQNCDYLVEIPLRGHKNSLNVANAFAMAASEISRQRKIIL